MHTWRGTILQPQIYAFYVTVTTRRLLKFTNFENFDFIVTFLIIPHIHISARILHPPHLSIRIHYSLLSLFIRQSHQSLLYTSMKTLQLLLHLNTHANGLTFDDSTF